ncbi:MAG: DUF2238 domain-containing protein [Desulfuromonas sp.]|nr:MAG: DUF2238 domain-containing protein [Desulfuromonas sp.]
MRILWVATYMTVLVWSVTYPKDLFIWFLEVLPALVGGLLLALTIKKFPLTPLLYLLILGHCVILMVGGHYTYAEVPLFDRISEWFGWSRNNYDKLGHFAQGFVPAMVAREIVIRRNIINGAGWRDFLIVSLCLGISAFYELIEWWVAVLTGQSAEAFLGTQGYAWDTQSDMALALAGAILALVCLGRRHDRQLIRLKG